MKGGGAREQRCVRVWVPGRSTCKAGTVPGEGTQATTFRKLKSAVGVLEEE